MSVDADLPSPIAAFDDAQRRTIALTKDVLRHLEAGMTERDVYELAETRLQVHGFSAWYHAPEVAIGGRRLQRVTLPWARHKLQPGDLVTVDLGPTDGESYGDFGYTQRFAPAEGTADPKVLGVARDCVRATCGYASRWKTVGELYIFARAWAVNNRMDLANTSALGHRILPKEGVLVTGFPTSAHLATLLARNRVHRLHPVRMAGMFALRPEVIDRGTVASFEEIVYVQDETHRVLGRASLDEAGTLGAG